MSDKTRVQQLHNRSARGDILSGAERVELETWYAQQDVEESLLLTRASASSLNSLREQADEATAQAEATIERIQRLNAENEAIRRDINALYQAEAAHSFDAKFGALTKEEEAALMEDIRQSEADVAAGRFITLDELVGKYANRLQEGKQ